MYLTTDTTGPIGSFPHFIYFQFSKKVFSSFHLLPFPPAFYLCISLMPEVNGAHKPKMQKLRVPPARQSPKQRPALL